MRADELAAPALGHGEPDGLGERRQHPPEEAADGRLGREVGVQRVAGDEPPRGSPANSSSTMRRAGNVAKRVKAQELGRLQRADELERAARRAGRA